MSLTKRRQKMNKTHSATQYSHKAVLQEERLMDEPPVERLEECLYHALILL